MSVRHARIIECVNARVGGPLRDAHGASHAWLAAYRITPEWRWPLDVNRAAWPPSLRLTRANEAAHTPINEPALRWRVVITCSKMQ